MKIQLRVVVVRERRRKLKLTNRNSIMLQVDHVSRSHRLLASTNITDLNY